MGNLMNCPVCGCKPILNLVHNEFVLQCPLPCDFEELLEESVGDNETLFNSLLSIKYSESSARQQWNQSVIFYEEHEVA